jgi:hypothetical protein
MQGSGYPRHFYKSNDEDEKSIVSSLIALQLHFNAGHYRVYCTWIVVLIFIEY